MSPTSVILALLALAGGAFSFYFLQVCRGKMVPNVWWIPRICQMSSTACQSITDTPYGRIMGRPNSFWGCLFYSLLFVSVVATEIVYTGSLLPLYLSVMSLVVTVYLIWGLIRLEVVCRLCITIHILNVVLFFILLVREVI